MPRRRTSEIQLTTAIDAKTSADLSVGFLLLPHFTILAFAAFIDALRLAADEGDLSRQIHCHWTVMGSDLTPVESSSGVKVELWETYRDPADFDYIVVIGGLLHQGQTVSPDVIQYLKTADAANVALVGVCTGSFALIHAGLMKNRRCCVSWFHYKDLINEFSHVIPVAEQLFVDDGDRITCAGGAVTADLAAYIIERHRGQRWARKSLRIMVMDNPRPANTPQPQPPQACQVENDQVKRALLLLEQNMSQPLSTGEIAKRIHLSKRQLERLFVSATGESLQSYYRNIRLHYGLWLLKRTRRTITDIAQECGFADTAHFSRTFRGTFNMKPTQARQNSKELIVNLSHTSDRIID